MNFGETNGSANENNSNELNDVDTYATENSSNKYKAQTRKLIYALLMFKRNAQINQ